MRAIGILLMVVFFFFCLGGKKVNGQALAIGHACAEIVESVSVASATISDFELSKSSESINKSHAAGNLNLGAITLNSGKDVTCNIVLTSASVTNDQGNAFTIDPAVQNTPYRTEMKSAGLQTVQLGATANLNGVKASGLYAGTYTVVFAYN
jgi:hypothetical protein